MRLIEFNGMSRPVCEWAKLTGISSDTITKRLNLGWSAEEALTAPVGKQGPRPKPALAPSLALELPALSDWQRDVHAAHRQMTRLARAFIRQMEEQMAELRHGLDQHLAAQRDEAHRHAAATPGEGQKPQEIVRDRCSRVTQESV